MGTKEEKDTRKKEENTVAWYVMRDLKRPNALEPAYKMLEKTGLEVFTPLIQKVTKRGGRLQRKEAPAIHDLLFVHGTRQQIDPIERATRTFQYRYVKGGTYKQTMTVREVDMERFITAVRSTQQPRYYAIGEITPDMIGRTVRIHGGSLNGFEASLLKVRGTSKKRIIVELPLLVTAAVEVTGFDFIETVT